MILRAMADKDSNGDDAKRKRHDGNEQTVPVAIMSDAFEGTARHRRCNTFIPGRYPASGRKR